ncbi:Alw26I/Eco31I/Esp3I family type II restriction m6 adenine DNA methyltransferase [Corynebacterium mucifaciens]|uniref:site-specific DNA-methyltransferase (adenine-specific) n=2 Tax=Corynebacterium mucifaciens TaxID=57171 RepID=A0ABV2NV57_9CORY
MGGVVSVGESAALNISLKGVIGRASTAYHQRVLGGENDADRLKQKRLGQFFTPDEMGERVARGLIDGYALTDGRISIVDPFCGDGRLLRWTAEAAIAKWGTDLKHIDLRGYEIDPVWAEVACERLQEWKEKLGYANLLISVTIRNADFLTEVGSSFTPADLCITNPPWLQIPTGARADSAYRDYGKLLGAMFPESVAVGGFRGVHVNLARVGAVAALKSVTSTGSVAVIIPSSLLSDVASQGFRGLLFRDFEVTTVERYPAAMKIFTGIDYDVAYFIANRSSEGRALRLVANRPSGVKGEQYLSLPDQKEFFGPSLRIADFETRRGFELFNALSHFPPIGDHPGVRVFREIDETRISEKFDESAPVQFVKGRNIARFSTPRELPRISLDGQRKFPGLLSEKIVWRDVSRRSQVRRVHATLVGSGVVAGNSLGCLQTEDHGGGALRYYLGLLNSMPAEFQVLGNGTANHVSVGAVKALRFPIYDGSNLKHQKIVSLVGERLISSSSHLEEEIDLLVVDVLGLRNEDLDEMYLALRRNA